MFTPEDELKLKQIYLRARWAKEHKPEELNYLFGSALGEELDVSVLNNKIITILIAKSLAKSPAVSVDELNAMAIPNSKADLLQSEIVLPPMDFKGSWSNAGGSGDCTCDDILADNACDFEDCYEDPFADDDYDDYDDYEECLEDPFCDWVYQYETDEEEGGEGGGSAFWGAVSGWAGDLWEENGDYLMESLIDSMFDNNDDDNDGGGDTTIYVNDGDEDGTDWGKIALIGGGVILVGVIVLVIVKRKK